MEGRKKKARRMLSWRTPQVAVIPAYFHDVARLVAGFVHKYLLMVKDGNCQSQILLTLLFPVWLIWDNLASRRIIRFAKSIWLCCSVPEINGEFRRESIVCFGNPALQICNVAQILISHSSLCDSDMSCSGRAMCNRPESLVHLSDP